MKFLSSPPSRVDELEESRQTTVEDFEPLVSHGVPVHTEVHLPASIRVSQPRGAATRISRRRTLTPPEVTICSLVPPQHVERRQLLTPVSLVESGDREDSNSLQKSSAPVSWKCRMAAR